MGMLSLWSCNTIESEEKELNIDHVIVIGFDGLSPDGLQHASTPTFDRLMKEGAYTMHARSVLPTSSSSNWASMIMGAGSEQHGITSNAWERDNFTLPAITQNEEFLFPTIFKLIDTQKESPEIGAIYHWGGFGRLFEKSAVDFDEHLETEDETAVVASNYIKNRKAMFTFVHFDHVDHAGHEFGHETVEYYKSVEKADVLLKQVIKSIEEAGMAEKTLVIISADHGGLGKGHGGESLQEIEIPFILWGPTVKKNYELKYPVYQYDNAATVAYALGIKIPRAWIGKPVIEAFEGVTLEDGYPTLVQLKKPEVVPASNGYEQEGGLFNSHTSLILKNLNEEGVIKYTMDGSVPKNSSPTYLDEVNLTQNTVVKSAVFVNEKLSSPVTEAFFRIKPATLKKPVTYDVFYLKDLSFLPALGTEKPAHSGYAFEITSEEVRDYIKSNTVFRFKSKIEVTENESYEFTTRSDDGSKLFIDGQLVVDNDGDHGVREKNGDIKLSVGTHTIEVLWFNGGGDGWLDVYIQSAQLPKQLLSTNLLRAN